MCVCVYVYVIAMIIGYSRCLRRGEPDGNWKTYMVTKVMSMLIQQTTVDFRLGKKSIKL